MSRIEFKCENIKKMNFVSSLEDDSPPPLIIEVSESKFPFGGMEFNITEIGFYGDEVNKLKTIITAGKVYQIDFEDSEVEDDRTPTMSASHSASASKVPTKKPNPNKLILHSDAELGVVYNNHEGTIKVKEKTEG